MNGTKQMNVQKETKLRFKKLQIVRNRILKSVTQFLMGKKTRNVKEPQLVKQYHIMRGVGVVQWATPRNRVRLPDS